MPHSLQAIGAASGGGDVLDLAHAIQLSLAPVFLLSAVTAMLGVSSTRLARVIDRARELQGQPGDSADLVVLRRRMALLTRAIEGASITGILVAVVVAVTFVSTITVFDLVAVVVPLFVLAMLSLILALLLLLLDSRIASRQIRRLF
jgi:hypothetical protein